MSVHPRRLMRDRGDRARIAAAKAAIRALQKDLARRRRKAEPARTDKVTFIVGEAHATTGIVRTVFNLAAYLAPRYEVEIISVLQRTAEPGFPYPPGVKMSVLNDRTAPSSPLQRLLGRQPSIVAHPSDSRFWVYSLYSDLQLLRRLRRMEGILITTRPSLNLIAAQWAPSNVITVAQEHMHFETHVPELNAAIRRWYPELDGLGVLTAVDHQAYSDALGARPLIKRIPNAATPLPGGRSTLDSKIVVGAGRLRKQKGFDMLIEAWQQIGEKFPDWQVHLYGIGEWEDKLRRQIEATDQQDRIFLKGTTDRMGEVLSNCGLFVLSSRFEGFPMVLLEAMSKGVPVVAFDCPTGPSEIMRTGENGTLVPPKDPHKLAEAIIEMLSDDPGRRRMGAGALETSAAYSIDQIGARWEAFFAEAAAARSIAGSTQLAARQRADS